MPQLHVKISWLYFFGTYPCILQTSLEDLEWWANIHGTKEHETIREWEGGGSYEWI
jgi:hypothetical protein